MLKGFRNVLVGSLLMFLVVYAVFIVKTSKKEFDITENMEKVTLTDEELVAYQNLVNNNALLRRGSAINSEIDNDEFIKFVLDNLKNEEYERKVGYLNDIVCAINWVDYIYTPDCSFIYIKNDVFMEYQLKYFNTSKPLIFNELDYKGLLCKNDGTGYYCLKHDAVNSDIKGYSIVDSVYVDDEKYIIRDYYVNVKMDDLIECDRYFDLGYCADRKSSVEPVKDDNTEKMIKEHGAMFEYVFLKNGENYYISNYHILK